MIYRANMVMAVVGVLCGSLLLATAVRGQQDGGSAVWTAVAGGVLLLAVLGLVLELRQWRRRSRRQQQAGGSAKE